MEEDLNSENEEVTPQDTESNMVEEQVEESSADQNQGQEEDQQERNFKALRKKAQDAERRAYEAEQRSKQHEELMQRFMQQSQPSSAKQEERDEFADIDPSDYANFGMTSKLIQKEAEKIAERKYNEMEQKRESSRFRERLKSKYADFDDIVNSETIAILEQKDPELANTIADLKDPYKMGLQTYNLIKSMNLVPDVDKKRHAREVEKKIEKSEKTVQSPQAYNKRPMAQAFSMSNMSEAEKKKVYEEMMGFASQSPGY